MRMISIKTQNIWSDPFSAYLSLLDFLLRESDVQTFRKKIPENIGKKSDFENNPSHAIS